MCTYNNFEEVAPKLTDEEQLALDTLNESVKLVDVGNGKWEKAISNQHFVEKF